MTNTNSSVVNFLIEALSKGPGVWEIAVPATRDEGEKSVKETSEIRVKIVGDHPHSGEEGVIEVKGGKVDTFSVLGCERKFMVKLTNCTHGTAGCYATHKNMRLLDNHNRV